MTIMEYIAKFNELNSFAPNQVGTEEMKGKSFGTRAKGKHQINDCRTLI